MRLSNLIAPDDGAFIEGDDRLVSGVSSDSRGVKAGFVFVAIEGTKQNGAAYIGDAITHGATTIVVDSECDPDVPADRVTLVKVPNARHALSLLASRYYPRQPQTIAAVTGTSGKTSTVQFTRELWKHLGHEAASLGTLGLISPKGSDYGSLTTPDAVTLHQTLDKVAGEGVTHLAMEASSHGIHLRRLDNVRVNLAAFTNLSRDHLDYHESMERYFSAKLRLFTSILQQGGTAVLNADIAEFDDIQAICAARALRVLSFGHKGSDITLKESLPLPDGQMLKLDVFGKAYDVKLPVIGGFQVFNSLCALGLAIASGEAPDKSVAALAALTNVPGRLELIGTTPSGGTVFVDYAHKPAALENVLKTLRPHLAEQTGGKLHVVFGCGGNRDKGKRPIMGEIAQRLADRVIVTDDNPRHENADAIRQEILAGCTESLNLREIGNRAEAIAQGVSALGAGDILVIAGKGHEEGQILGNTVLPFNDAHEARKALGLA